MSPIGFIHIPKTAGQSLISWLLDAYQPDEYSALYDRNIDKIVENPKLIYGHFSIGEQELFYPGLELNFFTFLRHPLKRLKSQYVYDRDYYFSVNQYDSTYKSAIFSLTPEEFILSTKIWYYDNCMTRMISGVGDRVPFGYLNSKNLSQAKDNMMKMFFVGFTDYFDDSIRLLSNALGRDELKIVPEVNKSVNKFDVNKEINTFFNSTCQTLNCYDMQLYNWALEHFGIQVRKNNG